MPRDPKLIDVGPSASGRWSVCTASPQFIVDHADQLPKEDKEYADEGSVAHHVASQLLEGKDPGTVAAPMMEAVKVYVDYVRQQIRPGDTLLVEKALNLFYLPHRSGIVDAAVFQQHGVYINDLKYGQGVSVEAEGNTQLAIYAESLLQAWEQIMDIPDNFRVVMSIIQPRDRNNPEPIRAWELNRAELREFTNDLRVAAELALAGKGEFHPSPKACQFCSAKGLCAAYAHQGLVALPEEARVIELPHPGTLTREQRVQALKAKKVLAQWMEALEDQEVNDLANGAEPIGLKLVAGKTNRQWRDVEEAQKLLSNHLGIDDMRPRTDLISPAAAERALKGIQLSTRFANRMASLITKPEGKPTLVTADDPRPALSFDSDPNNGLKQLD